MWLFSNSQQLTLGIRYIRNMSYWATEFQHLGQEEEMEEEEVQNG